MERDEELRIDRIGELLRAALARKAAETFDARATVEGLILLKHGIFTFGADARESYERMIEMVTRAEERLSRNRKTFAVAKLPHEIAPYLEDAAHFTGGRADAVGRPRTAAEVSGLLRMASRVLLEPVPGMTLIRPAACSTTVAMTRSCSS